MVVAGTSSQFSHASPTRIHRNNTTPFDERQSVGYDSKMLSLSTWRRRISKAWRKKVKDKRGSVGPREITTRMQGPHKVTLGIWNHKHIWTIMRNGDMADWTMVRVDKPLSQAELFRWLAETQPIE